MMEPIRGKRTLIETFQYLATVSPSRVLARVPIGDSFSDGFKDYTVQMLNHAVDACSAWLVDLCCSRDDFETLAYVGINDLRYFVIVYAAVKCGKKVYNETASLYLSFPVLISYCIGSATWA